MFLSPDPLPSRRLPASTILLAPSFSSLRSHSNLLRPPLSDQDEADLQDGADEVAADRDEEHREEARSDRNPMYISLLTVISHSLRARALYSGCASRRSAWPNMSPIMTPLVDAVYRCLDLCLSRALPQEHSITAPFSSLRTRPTLSGISSS